MTTVIFLVVLFVGTRYHIWTVPRDSKSAALTIERILSHVVVSDKWHQYVNIVQWYYANTTDKLLYFDHVFRDKAVNILQLVHDHGKKLKWKWNQIYDVTSALSHKAHDLLAVQWTIILHNKTKLTKHEFSVLLHFCFVFLESCDIGAREVVEAQHTVFRKKDNRCQE